MINMTKLQQHALTHLLNNASIISSHARTYESHKGGGLVLIEEVPHREVERRFGSADYKLGWQNCHAHINAMIQFILEASPADLRKYAGRS